MKVNDQHIMLIETMCKTRFYIILGDVHVVPDHILSGMVTKCSEKGISQTT